MRIDNLPLNNAQTQGAQRREWLRQYSPEHLQQCKTIILHALQQRSNSVSRCTVIIGAGACTEIPLAELARASDEVVLADIDLAAMKRAWSELNSPALRRKVRLLQADVSGGVNAHLMQRVKRQDWDKLVSQGAQAVFDAAALCLEQCTVPDLPKLETLGMGESGLVISSLILSQLFSYPILDLLDHIQRVAPKLLSEQERHHRYQEAAQNFRIRVINVHLHLIRSLLDTGGTAALLSDIRGFVFSVYGTDHDAQHRRAIPLVSRAFPDLVRNTFSVAEEVQWEWITDLPSHKQLGRGYEVAGYVLCQA